MSTQLPPHATAGGTQPPPPPTLELLDDAEAVDVAEDPCAAGAPPEPVPDAAPRTTVPPHAATASAIDIETTNGAASFTVASSDCTRLAREEAISVATSSGPHRVEGRRVRA